MQRGSRHGLSLKNEYRLDSKFREYELIYFCLQYPEWKRKVANYDICNRQDEWADPTGELATTHALCKEKIRLVEETVKKAVGKEELYEYILKGVTEDVGFTYLHSKLSMPCGHGKYYQIYHKFFYLLSQEKHTL